MLSALATTLLLGAAPPAAKPPAAKPPAEKPSLQQPKPPVHKQQILVWSGATKHDVAARQLAALAPLVDELMPFLQIEPAVVESATVKGLKPGFFIVSLGVCSNEDAPEMLKLFQSLRSPVYAKPVEYRPQPLAPLPCPMFIPVDAADSEEEVYWSLSGIERVDIGKEWVVGLTFSYSWDQQGDFAMSFFETQAVFAVLDGGGAVLATQSVASKSDASTGKLSRKGKALRLVTTYADPRCDPSGDEFTEWRQVTTASIKGGTLTVDEGEPVEIKSGSCGYAAEDALYEGPDAP